MEMTAPVLSGNGAMSFTLPSNYTMENAPRPTNNEIQLKEVGGKYAVMTFNWNYDVDSV
jgi:hypothetical protein